MKRPTAHLVVLLAALGLAACAGVAPLPPPASVFHDAVFRAPARPIDPAAALAVSPAMHAYLASRFLRRTPGQDRRKQLIEALSNGDLRLEYDAAMTRTAAEAFEARAGNCLALVLMTSAFAHEMGLQVRYQSVLGEETWDRSDDLYIAIGHVNLVLELPHDVGGQTFSAAGPTTIDFLPPRDAARLRTEPIEEKTVIAMYLNNRAVESLTRGQVDDAYWWSRQSILVDPGLTGAYVTLGVVYRSAHHPELAEDTLRRIAEREPDNVQVMADRMLALRDLGRDAEASALARRLDALDPNPPFSFFRRGMAALRDGRPDLARRWFAKEVARAPFHDEFEYWLAVSYLQLDDVPHAAQHLQRALDASTTRKDHDLYAAKLERVKALQTQ